MKSGDFTPAVITDWREVPLEALERRELRELLRSALESLPRDVPGSAGSP